ncbi:hypothetical protein QQM41_14905 (plasmid) [Acetobacter sp. AC2005]|uniref:hypothetical protein n=1 Tax=Acetobacter sp. AC2005 TaxID=3134142 RepID=UPI0030CEA2B6
MSSATTSPWHIAMPLGAVHPITEEIRVDHLEREGLRIEAVPVPSLSPPALVAVTLAAFLAARERTTLAEIMQNVIDVPPEKELLVMLKNAGWESRRTATGRFWVKTRG